MATKGKKAGRVTRTERPSRPTDVPASAIYKGKVPRLYVRERMEERRVDVGYLSEQLGMHEKAVYKAIKNPTRIWKDIQHWAAAMGLNSWRDLTIPPGQESIDAKIDRLPDEHQQSVRRTAIK